MSTYLILFFTSLGSATLLPMYSEALFFYSLSQNHNAILLWITATSANTLGSMINYALGYKAEAWLEKRRKLNMQKMDRYRQWFKRWGGLSLWLSWAPIIGDPLTLTAGIFRYPFWKFTLIVFCAKGARYGVIAIGYLGYS